MASIDQMVTSRSVFEVDIDNYYLTAGIINKRSIIVQNEGEDADDVEAQLSSNTPFISVLDGSNKYLGNIKGGKEKNYPVQLMISKDTPIGPYSLTLVLIYVDDDLDFTSSTYILGIVIDSVEQLSVKFQAELQDNHLTAGIQTFVGIRLSNLGPHQVHQVEAQLISETSSIVVLEDAYHYFEHLNSNETINFTALLSISQNIPLGPYTLLLNLEYQLGAETRGDSYTLGFVVDSIAPSKIQITSISRDEENVVLTLENVGNETLSNIFVSLIQNGLIIGTPYERYIDLMAPSNKTILTFQVKDDLSSVEVIINGDSFSEHLILPIPATNKGNLAITSIFPSRKVNLGTTVVYDILLRNRGPETFYYLGIQGLPQAFTIRFTSNDSEISGVILKEAQEALVSLTIDLPKFPRGFVIDESIIFHVIAVDAITYSEVINETPNEWLANAAGTVELTLTPTIRDILEVGGKTGENDLATPTSEIHYPGIPYSFNNLPLGSYLAPKFVLTGNQTYIFSLYGDYVGTDIDLNLHVFNASGTLIDASYSSRGQSDTVEIYISTPGIFLIVITNDESLSQRLGAGTLLITEKWAIEQASNNSISLDEKHYPDFMLNEIKVLWVDVGKYQGQEITLQIDWSSSFGAELRVYPFSRNSQKNDYDPLASNYSYNSSLIRSSIPQNLNMTYQIARDEEALLIVLTKVQGSGEIYIQLSFSSPLIDFWSYQRHRKEFLIIIISLAIIGLFSFAYLGEKYIR